MLPGYTRNITLTCRAHVFFLTSPASGGDQTSRLRGAGGVSIATDLDSDSAGHWGHGTQSARSHCRCLRGQRLLNGVEVADAMGEGEALACSIRAPHSRTRAGSRTPRLNR